MKIVTLIVTAFALVSASCIRVKVDPVEINLNVKIQQAEDELDSFFSDIDAASKTR